MERDFLKADDIAQMLGVSQATAYRLMRVIRQELESKGLLTLRGVVPRKYFMERMGVA